MLQKIPHSLVSTSSTQSCCRWRERTKRDTSSSHYHNGCFEAARWLGAREAIGVGGTGSVMENSCRRPLALLNFDLFSLCGLVPVLFPGLQWESRLSSPTTDYSPCRFRYYVIMWHVILPSVDLISPAVVEWCLIDLNGLSDRWTAGWRIVNMLPHFWSMLQVPQAPAGFARPADGRWQLRTCAAGGCAADAGCFPAVKEWSYWQESQEYRGGVHERFQDVIIVKHCR